MGCVILFYPDSSSREVLVGNKRTGGKTNFVPEGALIPAHLTAPK